MRTTLSLLLTTLLGLWSCRSAPAPIVAPTTPPPIEAVALPPKVEAAPPPLSLTASDGTGLSLAQMTARAVVDDPLTLTELTLGFDNPRDETMEGRFEIRLPPGARVTRFAMEIGGQWQEAEVVEKQQARRTYEVFLHQQKDPALLEKDTGNRFRARVFPIGPRERKRLRLSYTQTLSDPHEPYRLRTLGLPWLEHFEATVVLVDPEGGESKIVRREQRSAAPKEDLVIMRRAPSDLAVRHGERVLARVEPLAGLDPGELEPLPSLTVLLDTSASRALELPGDVEQLGALLSELSRRDPAMPLRVMAFDQEVVPMYEGAVGDFGDEDRARLVERKALGASNLSRALGTLRKGSHPRVLLVSDGLASAGKDSPAALRTLLTELEQAGVRRLDAFAVGGVRDEDRLRALVTGPLAASGVLLSAEDSAQRSAQRLQLPTFDRVRLQVPGAAWWSPQSVDGLQPGDHVMLYAQLPETEPLLIELPEYPEASRALDVRSSDSALVERTWLAAKVTEQIEQLMALEDAQQSAQLRQQIVDRSVEHRIVNDLTALLVLETEQDYARFGLERRALSNILTVGESGVELLNRTGTEPPVMHRTPSAPPPSILEDGTAPVEVEPTASRDAAGISLAGTTSAESHYTLEGASVERTVSMEEFRNIPVGASTSRDFTQVVESSATPSQDRAFPSVSGSSAAVDFDAELEARSSPAPTSNPRPAEVRVRQVRARGGTLSSSDARIVAESNLDGVLDCYEQSLAGRPNLRGGLSIELTLDADGKVSQAQATGGRLASLGRASTLRTCVQQALLGWVFHAVADRVELTLSFRPHDGPASVSSIVPPTPGPRVTRRALARPVGVDPYDGTYARVRHLLDHRELDQAWDEVWTWHAHSPNDVMALVALGEVAKARGEKRWASRAFGSLIDLHPSRAEMRRFAAAQLESLDDNQSLRLAVDSYRQARDQRPDHPNSHRSLAFALLRRGQPKRAFTALEKGLTHDYPDGRFLNVDRILREDLGIIAAAWLHEEPTAEKTIIKKLAAHGIDLARQPSLRFVLSWETDANDVDLHIFDARREHAYYSEPEMSSGGELYADVTTGFGPECFGITGFRPNYPYRLGVHYYSRGPMGYGMGRVQIVRHDGSGTITMEERPFVVMNDDAYVDLGEVRPATSKGRKAR